MSRFFPRGISLETTVRDLTIKVRNQDKKLKLMEEKLNHLKDLIELMEGQDE